MSDFDPPVLMSKDEFFACIEKGVGRIGEFQCLVYFAERWHPVAFSESFTADRLELDRLRIENSKLRQALEKMVWAVLRRAGQ